MDDVRVQPPTGREAELALLRRLAEAARREQDLRVAVVGGEAGMGKTHLVQGLAQELAGAGAPTRALRGECLDLGSATLPYAPVLQALRPVLRDPAAAGLTIDDPTRAGLARLVPEMVPPAAGHRASGPGAAGPTAVVGTEVGHTQLFEHLLGVVEQLAVASGLLVLTIEDVHFAEPSTRDLLTFLVGNLGQVPVLLVLTVRLDEVGRRHPARPFLVALERSPRVTPVTLGPLGPVAMTELVWGAAQDCSQQAVDAILDRAEGNPFFALELARDPGRLPAQVQDLLLDAVERCDPMTQAVLRAIAAAGVDIGHDALLQVTGLPAADLTAALRQAVDARLVEVTPQQTHRLRHALLQEAVEATLLPGEARDLHAALARVLAADGGLQGPNAARLARHHLAARQPALALEAAYAAGVQALDLVAYEEARRHLELVAELWDEVPDAAERTGVDLADVLVKAALSAISGHDDRRGIALAERALAHLDPIADPERTGIVWMWIGHGHRRDWSGAEPALRRAVATVPVADTPERARVLAALATALMLHGQVAEAEARCHEALAVAGRAGSTRDEVYALITLATILASRGDPQADAAFDRARSLADSIGRVDYRLRCDFNHSDAHMIHGRFAAGVAVAETGIAIARAHGLGRTYGNVMRSNALEGLVMLGRLQEAHDLAVENAFTAPDGLIGAHALLVLAAIELRLGDVEGATRHAESAARHFGPVTQAQFTIPLRRLQAEIAVAVGDHRGAVDLVRQAMPSALAAPDLARFPAPLALPAAEALAVGGAAAGDPGVRDALLEAVRTPAETVVHRAHRLLVEAILDVGAAARWDEAAAAFEDLAMPLEQARSSLGAAEALLQAGDRAGAAERYKVALRLATDIGAERLRHQVEALGRRGGFVGDRPVGDAFGLTAREHEVLRLVAEGLSNAEIGDRLFISAKTASVHVSHILAKLGVPTRQHAAAMAHRSGILG